jgi:hypothetical protein
MNVNELGWARTILHALLIAAAFLVASWLFVWFDSLLNRRLKVSSGARPLTQ